MLRRPCRSSYGAVVREMARQFPLRASAANDIFRPSCFGAAAVFATAKRLRSPPDVEFLLRRMVYERVPGSTWCAACFRSFPFSGRPVERPPPPNTHKYAPTHTLSNPSPPPPLRLQLLISSVQAVACLFVCVCLCERTQCVASVRESIFVCDGRVIGVKYSHRGCLSSPPPRRGHSGVEGGSFKLHSSVSIIAASFVEIIVITKKSEKLVSHTSFTASAVSR